MGSKRFYEHAQNLLGGVKREVGIIELRGQKGYYYSKTLHCYVMFILYYIILLYYHYIIIFYY